MAGPVLKAYQETPRDRIANALFSMTGRGPLATRFVEGMTGSTGLGANQMGVVDFSPIGPFLQAYEAGQQIGTKGQRGQGVANAMMAMVPIPGAAKGVNALAKAVGRGGEKRAVNALVDGSSAALDMSEAARMARAREQGFSISGYHGTPDSRALVSGGRFSNPTEQNKYLLNGSLPTEHWAAADYVTAKSYADPKRAWDYQNAEPAVLQTMMRMRNPLVIDAGGARWHGTKQALADARAAGHDGIIIRNVVDDYMGKGKPTTTYTVFNSEDIRLATDPFDPGGTASVFPGERAFKSSGLPTPATK